MLNNRDKRKIERLMDNCQYSDVIKSGRQAIERETDLDWYYFLALALDQRAVLQRNAAGRKKDQEEALVVLRRGLKKFPEDPRLWFSRGLVRLHKGQNKRALTDFQTAYELSGKDLKYLISIANAQRRLGKRGMAMENYMRALKSAKLNKAALYHNIAETWLEMGNEKKAKEAAGKGLALLTNKQKTATNRLLQNLLEKF